MLRVFFSMLCFFLITHVFGQKSYPSFPIRDKTGKVKPIPKIDCEPSHCCCCFLQKQPKALNYEEVKALIGYPSIAKEAGIEGTLVFRVLVSKEGKYVRHILIKVAHPLLSREVEKYLSKLTFEPAEQGGKPIEFWVNVPFKFELTPNAPIQKD